MLSRLFGVVMLLIGLTGVAASVVGVRLGQEVVDTVGRELTRSLSSVSESLDTVEETLILAKSLVVEVNQGLDTVGDTAADVSQAIDETQPLLNQLNQIASEELPASIEQMQEALPSVVQVAGVVDDTLTVLNTFKIDEELLGLEIKYDLGIDYDPPVPFDESIAQIGGSLDGMPERLRSLDSEVEAANQNLDRLSADVLILAEDLDKINEQIAEITPLLNDYITITTEVNDSTRQARASIEAQLELAKQMVMIFSIWLGLTQIAPLYLGWELIRGRRLQ